jgi:hypothetical protein
MSGRGEAPRPPVREAERVTAGSEPESPASTDHLMAAICDLDHIEAALRAAVRNKEAPGARAGGTLSWPQTRHGSHGRAADDRQTMAPRGDRRSRVCRGSGNLQLQGESKIGNRRRVGLDIRSAKAPCWRALCGMRLGSALKRLDAFRRPVLFGIVEEVIYV